MSGDKDPYDYASAIQAIGEATKAVVEQAGRLGGYVGEVVGTAPHNLFGMLADRMAHERARRLINLYAGTRKRLEDAGLNLDDLRPPPGSIEVPLLSAASMEDRDELVSLWQKLLAAAIAPATRNRVRARHIEIVKRLEPLDAWFLQNLVRLQKEAEVKRRLEEASGVGRGAGEISLQELIIAADMSNTKDDCYIAFDALKDLGLIQTFNLGGFGLTPLGRGFLAVVNDVSGAV